MELLTIKRAGYESDKLPHNLSSAQRDYACQKRVEAGVFGRLAHLRELGGDSACVLSEREVKSQAFSEPTLFYIAGEKKPTAFLYQTNGKGSGISSRKGRLKVISGKSSGCSKEVAVVPIGGKMVREAIDTDDFAQVALKTLPKPKKSKDLSSGFVSSVGYFTGDPWSVVANIDMLRGIVEKTSTDPGVMNKFTSTFGVVTGPICMFSAMKGAKEARLIRDNEGLLREEIRLVRSGVETASGATMVAVRSVGLAASRVSVSKAIIVANRVLGYISTGVGSLLYFLLMIPFALNAFRGGKFLNEWNKQKELGIDEGFKYLVEMIGLNRSDFDEVAKTMHFNSCEELYAMVKDSQKVGENVSQILTSREMICVEERVRSILSSLNPDDFPLISDWDQVRDCLLVKGLNEACRIVLKKKAEYTRRAGFESYTDIREVLRSDQSANIKGIDEGFKLRMINVATKETHSNLLINTLLVFVCTIGIGSFIGATIFSGGAPLLASIIVMLVMNVMMSGLDLYSFMEELRAMKTSSKKDLATIVLFIAMSILSLGISFVFAQGPVAKAVVVALGAMMISFQVSALSYVYEKLGKKEEESEDEKAQFLTWKQKALDLEIEDEKREARALEFRRVSKLLSQSKMHGSFD